MRTNVNIDTAANDLDAKLEVVRRRLRRAQRVVIAFSGGVDSGLLLALAQQELGSAAVGVLAVSPSLPASEADEARAFAERLGVRFETVRPTEFDDPRYLANDGSRCFWCRTALVDVLEPVARRERAELMYGAILDDLGDDRPGMKAAKAGGVSAPLIEAGLSKADVRALAQRMGLSLWDKPALACLASRIPRGTPIDIDSLQRVDRAEGALRRMGFEDVRVRSHGDVGRIELPLDRIDEAVSREAELSRVLTEAGFESATLDLAGYRPAGSRPASEASNVLPLRRWRADERSGSL